MSKVITIKPDKLNDHFSESAAKKLRELAEKFDASILMDDHGDVALLRRHYDEEGKVVVRHAPDPIDFYPVEWWTSFTFEEAREFIC